MASNPNIKKDALLADLNESIEKALEERMPDLAGALYRLQGSAKGWCDLEDCGGCPLAPLMCVNGIEDRVCELIEEHHAAKIQAPNSFTYRKKLPRRTRGPKFGKPKVVSPLPVGAYFERLQARLAEKNNRTNYKTDSSTSGLKLRWQRVNDAFHHSAPNNKSSQG
ncbi:MAG: hypothetical protein AB3N28_01765 [Kordiimonas sp.]